MLRERLKIKAGKRDVIIALSDLNDVARLIDMSLVGETL